VADLFCISQKVKRSPIIGKTSPRETPMPTSRTLVFNKPYGVLPCFTDPAGRPTLADFVAVPGVYAAGRLDQDSEGLMILTSDGSLARRITDPQHKLPKVYLAQVERVPSEDALDQMRKGVVLSGKRTRPAEVRLLSEAPQVPDRPMPIRFRRRPRSACCSSGAAPSSTRTWSSSSSAA